MSMVEFDIILEVDYLATYHASVDCFKKEVIFQMLGREEFKYKSSCMISALQMKKCLLKEFGDFWYLWLK